VHVIDTAGLRLPKDPVEAIGIERTWREAGSADLALLVVDAGAGVSESDTEILRALPEKIRKILVFNKIDLTDEVPSVKDLPLGPAVRVSAKSGGGLDLLRRVILDALGWQPSGEGQFIARERHVHALLKADSALIEARRAVQSPELFAEELRTAQQALATISGEFTADDLLGEIFSRFCIGK
jgi:tRNA modification GTPase